MGISFSHLLLTLCIILIVFGAGKLPRVMGDLGKGIRQFRSQLNDTETEETQPIKVRANNHQQPPTA